MGEPHPVGTVAQETLRLLSVLGVDATSASGGEGGEGGASATPEGSSSGAATHGPGGSCTWCPICRGLNALRNADEESVDKLLRGAALVASAVMELASQFAGPPHAEPADPEDPSAAPVREGAR